MNTDSEFNANPGGDNSTLAAQDRARAALTKLANLFVAVDQFLAEQDPQPLPHGCKCHVCLAGLRLKQVLAECR